MCCLLSLVNFVFQSRDQFFFSFVVSRQLEWKLKFIVAKFDDDNKGMLAGVAHGAFDDDVEALLSIRELFNYLPQSNKDLAPVRACDDPW
jgi:hypothetical protein